MAITIIITIIFKYRQTHKDTEWRSLRNEGSDPVKCSKIWFYFYFEITTFNCNQSSIHLYFSLSLSRWPICRGVALMLISLCPLSDSHHSHSSHLVLHLFIFVVTRSSFCFHFNSFKHYTALCCACILGSCPSLSLSLWKWMDAVQTVSAHRYAFLVKSLVMWFTIYLTSAERRQAGELNQRRREITHSPLHGNASNLTSYNLHCNNHWIKTKK